MSELNNGEKKVYEPVPVGDYLVSMNRIEEKATSKGGKMLRTSFKIEEGDYENRLIFESFLIEGSPRGVEVSLDRLNKYLQALGVAAGLDGIGNDLSKLDNFTGSKFIAGLKIKQDNEYVNKAGITVNPSPRNAVASFKAR